MSQSDVELQRPTPTPPAYTGWQAAVARYFNFDYYKTGVA